MFLVGSVVLFLISLVQEPGEIVEFLDVPPLFWLAFFGSGMIGTAVGHMLYNYSVGKAGPSKAAIFINLNTLFTLVGSSVFLGEDITTRHIFGLVLIVAGEFSDPVLQRTCGENAKIGRRISLKNNFFE